MNLRQVYRLLLRLYPKHHQAGFGAEMLAVFDRAAAERRKEGWRSYTAFAIRELVGLFIGAADEGGSQPKYDEMLEAQELLDGSVRLTIHAIAHHDFAGARRYWRLEHESRENLRLLCERRGNAG